MFSPAGLPGQVPASVEIVGLLCFGWLGSAAFSTHDAAVPTCILGRFSLRPAAFVFCHVPRVFLRVEVFQSALLTARTVSTFSTQVRLFLPFSWVHVFVNLERLSASGTHHVARFSPVYALTRLSGP